MFFSISASFLCRPNKSESFELYNFPIGLHFVYRKWGRDIAKNTKGRRHEKGEGLSLRLFHNLRSTSAGSLGYDDFAINSLSQRTDVGDDADHPFAA